MRNRSLNASRDQATRRGVLVRTGSEQSAPHEGGSALAEPEAKVQSAQVVAPLPSYGPDVSFTLLTLDGVPQTSHPNYKDACRHRVRRDTPCLKGGVRGARHHMGMTHR